MNPPLDRLYSLLPALYRQRDIAEGEPLRALLAAVESEFRIIEQDITDLYDNWFIETCAEWVVPYIGDLLSTQELYGESAQTYGQQQRRAYVANTLAYRRRKGTATVLEQLVRDVTDWRARAVEFYQVIATTQNLSHVRPELTTVDLRSNRRPDQIGSPFEQRVAYTAEIRRMGVPNEPRDRGRYSVQHIGLFIWRLQSYPLERVLARRVAGPDSTATGRYYTFDPLGNDRTPLFNHPQTETDILHLAAEYNVPAPLRRIVLEQELADRRHAHNQGLPLPVAHYLGRNPILQIFIDGQPQPIPPEEIQIRSLTKNTPNHPEDFSWQSIIPTALPPATVAIDPEQGRFAFLGTTLPKTVEVSYLYGFSGDVGGGPYNREEVADNPLTQAFSINATADPSVFAEAIDPLVWRVQQAASAQANPLASAVQAWNRTVQTWQALRDQTAIPLQKIILPPDRVSCIIGDAKLPAPPPFQSGIVEGLTVEFVQGFGCLQPQLVIYSGLAIDAQGRSITIAQPLSLDLKPLIDQSKLSLETQRFIVVASLLPLSETFPPPIQLIPETVLESYPAGMLIPLAGWELWDGQMTALPDYPNPDQTFHAGIVQGFKVLTPHGRMEVIVTAGTAVDRQGNIITQTDNQAIDLRSHQGTRGELVWAIERRLSGTTQQIEFIPLAELQKQATQPNTQPNPRRETLHLAYLDIPQVEATFMPVARIIEGLEVTPIADRLAVQISAGQAKDSLGAIIPFTGQEAFNLEPYRDQTVQLVLFTGADRRYSRGTAQIIQPGKIDRTVHSQEHSLDLETYIVLANLYLTPEALSLETPQGSDRPSWLRPAGRILDGLTLAPVAPNQPLARIEIQPGQAIDGEGSIVSLEQACQFDLGFYAGRTLILFIADSPALGFTDLEPLPDHNGVGWQYLGIIPEEPRNSTQGTIVLGDNGTYSGNLTVKLPADRQLEILAANGYRPHLHGNLNLQGTPTLEAVVFNQLTLDGLLIEGQLRILPGQLQHLEIRHCTLRSPTEGLVVEAIAPQDTEECGSFLTRPLALIIYCLILIQHLFRLGLGLDKSAPKQNLAQLMRLAFLGFNDLLTGVQSAIGFSQAEQVPENPWEDAAEDIPGENDRLEISLKRSLTGSLVLADTVPKLQLEDCIIDGSLNVSDNENANNPENVLQPAILAIGAAMTVNTTTVLGSVKARSLQASNSLFTEKVTTLRQQVGCLRFCYVPEGSRTPTRYRCQPQQALMETLNPLPAPVSAIVALNYPNPETPDRPLATTIASTAGGGIFVWKSGAQAWEALPQQPANRTITTLLAHTQTDGSVTLWAGSADGSLFQADRFNPYRLTLGEPILWRSVNLPAINTQITEILPVENSALATHLLAATAGDGLLVISQDTRHNPRVLTTRNLGQGTISSNGTSIIGSSNAEQPTAFVSQLRVGDLINAAGQSRKVVKITDNYRLTLNAPFHPNLPPGTVFTINTGLTNPNITALLIHADDLWLGTAGNGVFRAALADLTSPQLRWTAVSDGLTDRDISALIVDRNGQLFAGTEDGIFRLSPGQPRWEPGGLIETRITALATLPRPLPRGTISSQGVQIIGTNTFFTEDFQEGDILTALDQSRRIVKIQSNHQLEVDSAFCPDLPSGTPYVRHHPLYAATDDGQLWHSIDSGQTWEPFTVNNGITRGAAITALSLDPVTKTLQMGTVVGNFFQSIDGGKTWAAMNRGILNLEEKLQIMNRLQPRFTNLQSGNPSYGQLDRTCPVELYTGAEDGAEMGVFNFLKQSQREKSLQASLEESLRFGLEAGIFYMT
ncbi:hypothetical protein ACN4EG_18030 [Alkalinema pantanalense CENA528]|uniref:hypothetical protein n=1 Tax=Alkalinema pantanalense TaxID=1620705 RepID=UPI003D6E4DBA